MASQELGKGASLVGVHDAGNLFTTTTVEGALKEAITQANAAFTYGNNVKSDTVGVLLQLDKSLPIKVADAWATIISQIKNVKTMNNYFDQFYPDDDNNKRLPHERKGRDYWTGGTLGEENGGNNAGRVQVITDDYLLEFDEYWAINSSAFLTRTNLLTGKTDSITFGLNSVKYKDSAVVAVGNDVYHIGGYAYNGNAFDTKVNKVRKFHAPSNSFTTMAGLPYAIESSVAGSDGKKIMVAGGSIGYSTPENLASMYDIESNTTSVIPVLPIASERHSIAAKDGDFYVAGGNLGSGFYKYSVSTGTWIRQSSLAAGTVDGTLFILNGRHYYIVQGASTFTVTSKLINATSWQSNSFPKPTTAFKNSPHEIRGSMYLPVSQKAYIVYVP